MKVIVNGEDLILDAPIDINELLVEAKADQPEYVTVQLNGEFIERDNFKDTFVQDGDTVEFLYFMGGGVYEADE